MLAADLGGTCEALPPAISPAPAAVIQSLGPAAGTVDDHGYEDHGHDDHDHDDHDHPKGESLGDRLPREPAELADVAGQEPAGPAGAIAATDAFLLHSRPGADHTVYLDFDGHTTIGTTWLGNDNSQSVVSPAYDPSNDGAAFNTSELQRIIRIWQRVAEDFAPFEINVTTEEPTLDALTNSGGADTTWGTRVVITPDDWDNCGCGGFAYLTSFDDADDEPVFVFNTSEIGVSAATTHEVGHALGLYHDGQTSAASGGAEEYYDGHGSGETGWGPIMGSGYYQNVTTWDAGEYSTSSNNQDDFAVIASFGPGIRTDDHGDDAASSTAGTDGSVGAIVPVDQFGVIEAGNDEDWFQFNVTDGDFNLTIDSYAAETFVSDGAGGFARSIEDLPTGNQYSNLDVAAVLYDVVGNVVATSNPAGGLSASFNNLAVTAGTYLLSVAGTGFGNPSTNPPTGFVRNSSRGQYRITGTVPGEPLTVPLSEWTAVGSMLGGGETAAAVDNLTDANPTQSFTVDLADVRMLSVRVRAGQDVDIVLTDADDNIVAATTAASTTPSIAAIDVSDLDAATLTVSGAIIGSAPIAVDLLADANWQDDDAFAAGQTVSAVGRSVTAGGDVSATTWTLHGETPASSVLGALTPSTDATAFVDISATGTALNLSDDGEATIQTTVGNIAMPAGAVTVANNGGLISGTDVFLDYVNGDLTSVGGTPALLPYWDDLYSSPGNVYWQETSIGGVDALVVQWEDRSHYDIQGDGITFQVQLFDTGPTLAKFVYQDVSFNDPTYDAGASATVGVLDSDGVAYPFSSNTASLSDDLVLSLAAPIDVTETYFIDLTDEVGSRVDILAVPMDGGDLSTATLELFDADENLVATATPGGGTGGLSILNYSPLTGGTHTLRYGGIGDQAYELIGTMAGAVETEPNNGLGTAAETLVRGQPISGQMEPGDLIDFYRIEGDGEAWTITATPDVAADGSAISVSMMLTIPDGPPPVIAGPGIDLQVPAFTGTMYLQVERFTLPGQTAGNNGAYTITTPAPPAPAPQITSFRIDEGGQQRSIIRDLTLTVDSDVTVDAAGFTLTNLDTNETVDLSVTSAFDGTETTIQIDFVGTTSIEDVSLADGNYRLDIAAGAIVGAGGALDGDGDGESGGDYSFGDDFNDDFFRLLGDVNGNGSFQLDDFFALSNAYVRPENYRFDLDVNGDGLINAFDAFRMLPRYNGSRS